MKIKNSKDLIKSQQNDNLKDEENPAYLFSSTFTSLLVDIANGNIDAQFLAKRELAARGMGKKGEWVGFSNAAKVHGLK